MRTHGVTRRSDTTLLPAPCGCVCGVQAWSSSQSNPRGDGIDEGPPFCTHILRHRRCSVVPGPRGDRCCHPALLQDVPSSSAPTAGSLALVRVLDP